jgi:glycosyltransferase involved in cell wall biosynthesis
LKNIKGEKIFASKPLMSSFGVGLLAKYFLKKKLFLDIDDDEIALLTEGKNFRQKFLHLNPDKYLLTLYLEPYILKCDGWTVSNYQLRDTYGGKIIPHARDPEKLKAPAEKSELKRRLSLPPECFLIGHIGSYRPHKGVERIIQALDLLNDPEILFLYTANKDYLPVKPYIKRIPEFPMRRLPEILGACDFAVFPLVESFISIYQLPAKIIDAMFLEVPFVVTETKSIKQVVQDEDLLIPFEVTIEQISQKIAFFKNYPQIRREKALKLKKFALSNLSVEKVSSELLQVLNK